MKQIIKLGEPTEFTEWKAHANTDWKPTFSILAGRPKEALKMALMKEQGFICCYCERRINESDSHIEHFIPQHLPGTDPLDYTNMLCSCQNQVKKGEPRHCGNLKDDWYDPKLTISPLTPFCNGRFSFFGDGRMNALDSSDTAAIETIKNLGLDIPKLRALRNKAFEPFLDDSLSSKELTIFLQNYLTPSSNGEIGEFGSAINYIFNH